MLLNINELEVFSRHTMPIKSSIFHHYRGGGEDVFKTPEITATSEVLVEHPFFAPLDLHPAKKNTNVRDFRIRFQEW